MRNKAVVFAKSIEADLFLVESVALIHDLNYLVRDYSKPEEAKDYRKNILSECGYFDDEIERIEKIILESDVSTRGKNISNEGKALSDADMLFKALPTTSFLFTGKYIEQNKIDIKKLADDVVSEQQKLFDEGIYFYTDLAKKKYLKWGKAVLGLWEVTHESLEDEDVSEMLKIASDAGVI